MNLQKNRTTLFSTRIKTKHYIVCLPIISEIVKLKNQHHYENKKNHCTRAIFI